MMSKKNDGYLISLETCKRIAKEEYKTVHSHFEQCDTIIDALSKKMQGVIEHGSLTLSKDKMLEDGL